MLTFCTDYLLGCLLKCLLRVSMLLSRNSHSLTPNKLFLFPYCWSRRKLKSPQKVKKAYVPSVGMFRIFPNISRSSGAPASFISKYEVLLVVLPHFQFEVILYCTVPEVENTNTIMTINQGQNVKQRQTKHTICRNRLELSVNVCETIGKKKSFLPFFFTFLGKSIQRRKVEKVEGRKAAARFGWVKGIHGAIVKSLKKLLQNKIVRYKFSAIGDI